MAQALLERMQTDRIEPFSICSQGWPMVGADDRELAPEDIRPLAKP